MTTPHLMVLYDGGCALCSREIDHYRRLTPNRPIDWIDITREPERLVDLGFDPVAAMREFHVIDAERKVSKGADGFILLWSALPYYRWLSSLCCWLGIRPLMRSLYTRFARWHFRRRCADGACPLDAS